MADGSTQGAALGVISDVEGVVNARLADSQEFAKAAQDDAQKAIDALGALGLPQFDTPPPVAPPDLTFTGDFDLDKVPTNAFGTVDGPRITGVPNPPALGVYTVPTIPDFVSSIDTLNIPEPPSPIDTSGLPSRPDIDTSISIPATPDLVMPVMDTLNRITIPDFVFPTLPTFDAEAPQFVGSPVSTVLQWSEPVYQTEILDDVLAQVRVFFQGGSGMPPAVEEAIFNRGSDRENQLVEQDVKAAVDEIELRGYTLPPGVLVSLTSERRQKALLAKQSAQREITIKAAEWMIENLKFAVQQGIACENLLVNLFLNQAERQFQAARFEIESQISYYNAQVALFNAMQSAYSVAAQVFKVKVDAALSQLEVYKAQIEGQIAIGQLNEQLVHVFTARVQALATQVEIYKAQVQAQSVKAEAAKTAIEAYGTDVQAYATKVNAQKTIFDAYTSRVNAEAAKAGIIDAEARAFASVVQGKVAQGTLSLELAKLPLEQYKSTILGYQSAIEADKLRMNFQVAGIQAAASAFEADTKRFIAQVEGEKAKADVEIKAYETSQQLILAYVQAQLKAYEVNVQKVLETARIQVQALTAMGTISSTLSAGAMAALHVGAQLSGNASVGASSNDQQSISTQTSTSTVTETVIQVDGTA